MSSDFIPRPDDAFNHFFDALSTYVTANAAALNVSTTQATALAASFTSWQTAWNNWESLQTTYNSLLQAKDAARHAGEALVRQINAAAQAGPNVTDTSRAAAGLPVHKTSHTPLPAIETYPVLYRVDNERLLQRLWFSDSATPGVKAKPAGAGLCEIRQTLVAPGGAAPVDPAAMPLLAMDTKSPHRTDFEPGDMGHTAYYAARWVGKNGLPGPWGLITGYVVV